MTAQIFSTWFYPRAKESHSPFWGVVPEVAKQSSDQQPIQLTEGVHKAAEVDQSRVVVGRVLVHIHDPVAAAGERRVASAGDIAIVV